MPPSRQLTVVVDVAVVVVVVLVTVAVESPADVDDEPVVVVVSPAAVVESHDAAQTLLQHVMPVSQSPILTLSL